MDNFFIEKDLIRSFTKIVLIFVLHSFFFEKTCYYTTKP